MSIWNILLPLHNHTLCFTASKAKTWCLLELETYASMHMALRVSTFGPWSSFMIFSVVWERGALSSMVVGDWCAGVHLQNIHGVRGLQWRDRPTYKPQYWDLYITPSFQALPFLLHSFTAWLMRLWKLRKQLLWVCLLCLDIIATSTHGLLFLGFLPIRHFYDVLVPWKTQMLWVWCANVYLHLYASELPSLLA